MPMLFLYELNKGWRWNASSFLHIAALMGMVAPWSGGSACWNR
jgi:hypothetical protein